MLWKLEHSLSTLEKNGSTFPSHLEQCLLVPAMNCTLFSVPAVVRKGHHVSFEGAEASIEDSHGQTLATGMRKNEGYYLDSKI